MTELVFILTEFCAPEPGARDSSRPRLPLLEKCLSRSECVALDSDWRGWLASRCAPAQLAAFSLAAIVGAAFRAAGSPKPESTGYWLATPVHWFAGLDSVQLHPSGLLQLSEAQQRALVTDFARVFSDSPWRLESLGQRELLLCGPPIDASGADPALFLGADPSAGVARGGRAAVLQRLGSEIEMWLHEHAVNQERARQGALPVTALWLWGAQAPTVSLPEFPLRDAQLFGADVYAQALWRLQGRSVNELSAASRAINEVPIGFGSDSVLLYPSLAETGMIDRFTQLEQCWLPGALRALRRGRVSGLHLIAGPRRYSLSRSRLMRWWRSGAPWWEQLA